MKNNCPMCGFQEDVCVCEVPTFQTPQKFDEIGIGED